MLLVQYTVFRQRGGALCTLLHQAWSRQKQDICGWGPLRVPGNILPMVEPPLLAAEWALLFPEGKAPMGAKVEFPWCTEAYARHSTLDELTAKPPFSSREWAVM
jgi:hypothetical protein